MQDRGDGNMIESAQVARNKLGWGVSFHLKAPALLDPGDGAKYFLLQNTYLDTDEDSVNPFLDPLALPVHYQ